MGFARIAVNFRKTQLGKLFGPPDFSGLTLFKNTKTSSSDKEIGISFSVGVKILSGKGT